MSHSRIQRGTGQLLLTSMLMLSLAAVAEDSPQDWLQRMSNAVQTTDYEGTVIRLVDGKAEALKVVHAISDGVVREKLIAQEGDGLEIIRVGNEVHCILPERKSVLVEEWNNQSTLFSTLPGSELRFGSDYDVRIVREERVAGRTALMLSIKPHDNFRYEHRLWLDMATAFPLQTQLISEEGIAIEQVKFADIVLGQEILASAVAPSYSTENFKWYSPAQRSLRAVVQSDWRSDDLPPGFQLVSAQEEQMPGSDDTVTHILYSDGLASVSVFIATNSGSPISKRSRKGASNTFSTEVGEYRVTAMGEVPAATVQRIAASMSLH